MEDLYRTLQVDPEAEPEVIEAAWRRLAQVYHPDGGQRPDAARMAAINQAHQVLRDPHQRALYDQERAQTRPAGTSNGRPRVEAPGSGEVGWVATAAPRCWRHRAWAVTRCVSCGTPLCADCAGRWKPPHCDRCVVAYGHNQQAWIAWPGVAVAAWLALIVIAFAVRWSSLFPTPSGWAPPIWPTLLVTYILAAGAVGGVYLVIRVIRALPRDARRRLKKSFGVLTALVLLPVTILAGAVFGPIGAVMALVAFVRGTIKVRVASASLRSNR